MSDRYHVTVTVEFDESVFADSPEEAMDKVRDNVFDAKERFKDYLGETTAVIVATEAKKEGD